MTQKTTEKKVSILFGVAFVIVMLVLAVSIPEPTLFQYTVFRIVLALAAAGVAATFPGFLHVEVPNWIKAGGSLAVFVIVFFYNPAQLVSEAPGPLSDHTIEKVTGDGQSLRPMAYREFAARVRNGKGAPVEGAKVLWQTPQGGDKAFVSATGADGIARATNVYAFANAGSYLQTATLVDPSATIGFVDASSIDGTTIVASFTFLVPGTPVARMTIRGALYAVADKSKSCDATAYVKARCDSIDNCAFIPTNAMCGDPARRRPKKLHVTYECDGVGQPLAELAEGEPGIIRCPSARNG